MLTPEQYLKVLGLGFRLEPCPFVRDLCGRIIRGKTDEDLSTLSDDPHRKIVFLTDSAGLSKMYGKSGYDMLITVGHHPDHIEKQVQAGKRYQLVVFPQTSAQIATWEGLFKATLQVYPDMQADLTNPQYIAEISQKKYSEYEQEAGFAFKTVDDASHPEFMSYEKYMQSGRTLLDLRRFLYHTLHIRELFHGDGYTYDEHGRRGVQEYLIGNIKIADIPHAAVMDIDVQLP